MFYLDRFQAASLSVCEVNESKRAVGAFSFRFERCTLTVLCSCAAGGWPVWTLRDTCSCWPEARTLARPRRRRTRRISRAICFPVGKSGRTEGRSARNLWPPTNAVSCVRPVDVSAPKSNGTCYTFCLRATEWPNLPRPLCRRSFWRPKRNTLWHRSSGPWTGRRLSDTSLVCKWPFAPKSVLAGSFASWCRVPSATTEPRNSPGKTRYNVF